MGEKKKNTFNNNSNIMVYNIKLIEIDVLLASILKLFLYFCNIFKYKKIHQPKEPKTKASGSTKGSWPEEN